MSVAVMERFERLLLTFRIDDLDSRIEDLRTGAAQLAVVSPEQVAREMDSKQLKPEKYVMVGAASWKGRRVQEIVKSERIIDFDPKDRMTLSYLKQFMLFDLVSSDRLYVNNNDALIELFRRGMGYGVLTLEVAKPHGSGRAHLIELRRSFHEPSRLSMVSQAADAGVFQSGHRFDQVTLKSIHSLGAQRNSSLWENTRDLSSTPPSFSAARWGSKRKPGYFGRRL